MASSLSMAQDVVICDVCNKFPVQVHCNKCDVSLCKGCVVDHVIHDSTVLHEVVAYQLKNADPIFPACKTHLQEKCETRCGKCNISLCAKCDVSGKHKAHDVTDLAELFKKKKDILSRKLKEIESLIYPKYEKMLSELETKMAIFSDSYEKLMSGISEQGKAWHREIDIITNQQEKDVAEMKAKDFKTMNRHFTYMKNLLTKIRQVVQDIKQLLKSNIVEEIMDASPETTFLAIEPKVEATPPSFSAGAIQADKIKAMFGSVTLSHISSNIPEKESTFQLLDSPYEYNDIDSEYKELRSVAASHNTDDVWVSGHDKKIKRFSSGGSLRQTFNTINFKKPGGLACTPDGQLFYSIREDKSIYSINKGKSQRVIVLEEGWELRKICSTNSGDILVSMWKDYISPKRVVRYTNFKEKQVIQFDQDGSPLYSTGAATLFICENGNGDICASDWKDQQVVVVNRAGKLRFRYTGNLPFHPRGIVTDSECQILVADIDNNFIHIVSEDGNLIRYIDNCHLSEPYDLSIDKNNNLFVAEFSSAKVKMIKYRA